MATDPSTINPNALRSEIRDAVINRKANACPMVVRLAWHASGTFDKADNSGGSNGATMRFEPETSDDANAGLSIIRDMLHLVKVNNPNLSNADLWTYAGTQAVEFLGGPKVPHVFCRADAADGSTAPPNGRLPDASQGAAHLRDVFGRMGFNDQEIVVLSGAHTLGRCHKVRSGFDGPWTHHPLKFDNQYFKNLINLDWTPRKWDGNFQYQDPSGVLMMLPTDLCLKTDPKFRPFVELYAKDEQKFFDDFATAFAKLLANGTGKCPFGKQEAADTTEVAKASAEFREAAMHGSTEKVAEWAKTADVNEVESSSGRTALHKAAFWGHVETVTFLLSLNLDVNAQDYNGDTALNDAVRFGHVEVVKVLVGANTNIDLVNKDGKNAVGLARQYNKAEVEAVLTRGKL
eukprot:TRINITY_DN12874_c0_g1_i1.p1 TRINITY_DN12874_c0_g1~~TRINITY_DN12874_c0_g1_i1.p1  ORF type:complete len:413 (+),score=142.26 TRINITY_DN12874_c0_g1_i1:30-1241(+)